MKLRKILATVVGTVQTSIGVLAVILVYILYFNSFGLREWLNVTEEFLPLQMLVLIVFGFFSILSGSILVREEDSGS